MAGGTRKETALRDLMVQAFVYAYALQPRCATYKNNTMTQGVYYDDRQTGNPTAYACWLLV